MRPLLASQRRLQNDANSVDDTIQTTEYGLVYVDHGGKYDNIGIIMEINSANIQSQDSLFLANSKYGIDS